MNRVHMLAGLILSANTLVQLLGAEPQAAPYIVAAGPYVVETVDEVVLHDAQRKKDLPVFVSYPKGDGKFPVIVFSHGAMGSGDMGFPIVQHWTSQGYVVLCPTHADSIKLQRGAGRDAAAGARGGLLSRALGEGNSTGRPQDVTFLLDSLDVLEEKVPALQGKFDRDRVGVGGHSLGAFTAQVVGGATLKLGGQDEPRSFADPRVKAILQLSGQGKDQQGLHEHSWDNLKLPMMCVTGSLDRGAQGQGPEWKRDPFKYSPPGHKYFLFIEGAHHGSFTGKMVEGRLPGAGRSRQLTPEQRERLRERFEGKSSKLAAPQSTESPDEKTTGPRADGRLGSGRTGLAGASGDQKAIFEWVKQATTAFWDAALKADATAKAWLASDALVNQSGSKAKLERR
ncbi:MAG: hypothetical protein FJ276_06820 [Planctomycetes bacterium]|nr:hypothetical protein [Planctomycetota bacterium]